jgi:nucleoside-diphosphate-sugar epimerase
MKILVLGSEGFIGGHSVNYFHSKGNEIHGVDFFEKSNHEIFYHQYKLDDPGCSQVFKTVEFDYCINAAGNGNVNISVTQPEKDFVANTQFTFQILESLRLYSPRCKYLHISSAAVYGNPEVLPINETSPIQPVSPYGWHKFMSEQICKEYFQLYGIQSAIIRPFSVYGPGLKKQIFWDVYMKSFQDSTSIELWGGGEEARDFIYIDDLISSIDIIIKNSSMEADIYNVASGQMTYIRDAVSILLQNLGNQLPINFNGESHKGNPIKWEADISKIKSLGFNPMVNLQEGLSKLANWMKSQKN